MSNETEQPLIEPLTEREMDVLSLLAQGKTNREIAEALVWSLNTVKWYARQIYGKLGVGDRHQAAQRALALGLLQDEQAEALPEHNLPAQLTPFVGRQEELAEIEDLLANPATRLITIVGPGGMGKTRLAIQAAAGQLHRNPEAVGDGVIFVSLAEIEDAQSVAESLNQILGLAPLEGEGSATGRLKRYLSKKRTLLILDNAEHLAGREMSGFLDELLSAAAGVMVLATSRRRLDVRGEQLFWVEGLQVPPAGEVGSQAGPKRLLETSSALTLFMQTARRVRPGFVLTEENAVSLIQICRLVEGMPLGIELAAAWIGLLTPEELLDELGRTPDILVTGAGNVPPGQRSLRAVFDTSWKLLADPEREAVRALSIFRGGFTRRAAKEVCDVTLPTLLALVNKCWLKRAQSGRFSIHELLRQYGLEALSAMPGQYERIRVQHSAYYCRWLAGQEEAILGPGQRETLAAVEQELSNVRTACLAAVETGQAEALLKAVHTLGLFYRWQGRYRAGDSLFETLLQEVGGGAEAPQEVQILRARLLVWRTTLNSLLGDDRSSEDLIREADVLVERLQQAGHEMRFERLYLALERGYHALLRTREPQEALRYFREVHKLAETSSSPWEEALAMMGLARARRNLRHLADAEQAAIRGIEILRENGNEPALAEAIALRGNILARMGRLQEAQSLLQKDLHLTQSHPGIEAYRLVNLGWVRFLLGQFDQAEAPAAQAVAKYRENEIWTGLLWATFVSEIKLHQGRYVDAVKTSVEMLPSLPPPNRPEAQAVEAFLQGAQALADEDWTTAGEHLQRSLAIRKPSLDWHFTYPHACLALATRGAGDGPEALHYLGAELKTTMASRAFPPLVLSLLAAALLLSDRGEAERAAEIYHLVWREPFAQNSVWLREVAGRELEEVSARLPTGARQAAKKRGQALDLWETAAALLEELATWDK